MSAKEFMNLLHGCTYERSLRERLEKHIKSFEDKSFCFAWVHTGKIDISMEVLLTWIKNNSLLPLRTGHIGDWHDMMLGCSESLDHNGIVCHQGWGRPYVYELTQTEGNIYHKAGAQSSGSIKNVSSKNEGRGDAVYHPGACIKKGERTALSLWHYQEGKFVEVDITQSYFVPFLKCQWGLDLVPLVEFHKNNGSFPDSSFFTCSIFYQELDFVKSLLIGLLKGIKRGDIHLRLKDVIDRCVTLDGVVVRSTFLFDCDRDGYLIGDTFYASEELVASFLVVPFIAGHHFSQFEEMLPELPPTLPLLSLSAILALGYALLNQGKYDDIVLHMEWGAFGSAGCPPLHKGYYQEKSSQISRIYHALYQVQKGEHIPRIFFVLLPSGILNLLPLKKEQAEIKAVDLLFSQIGEYKEYRQDVDKRWHHTLEVVSSWYKQHKGDLSLYFKQRFSKHRRVFKPSMEGGDVFVPDSFYALTTQQLSMILGAMITLQSQEESHS